MRKITLLLVSLLFAGAQMLQAQRTITGTVIGADDNQGIPGVQIVAKGTTTGTTTNVMGQYSLNVPSGATHLVFSFLGMATQEIAIDGKTSVDVVMQGDAQALEGIVVTAMGISRAEKTIGYSATTVKGDELSANRSSNVVNSLAGKVAGLQIQATSSDPGVASGVVIRGFGSINGSNQPLYVVDGVPLQSSSLQATGKSIAISGLSNIAADDIESTTVLKGAAATALYGSRASNGVIVITTKKGAKGENQNFSIEYNGGVQARVVSLLPTFQNDFGQGWNGQQTYIENGSWGPRLDGSLQVYGPIYNGQQLLHVYEAQKNNVRDFFEAGISQNHSLSINGVSADNKLDYFLSYSRVSDDGIIPTDADKYDRNTLAFRSGMKANDWLKVSTSVNFAKYETDVVGSYQGASVIDGLYEGARDVSIVDKQDLSSPFNTPEAYYTPYGITNPYWAIDNNYNHTEGKQLYGKLQIDVNPLKELTLSYRFGFDYSDYDMKMATPLIDLDDAFIDEDYGYAPSNMNQGGYVYSRFARSYEINHDFLAAYDRRINNKLTFNGLLGLNVNERYSTVMYGQANTLSVGGFIDLSNGSDWTSLAESQSKRRLIGLFGDATLGYDDFLFLNVTARNDWSSTLPIGNNSFFYPGVTLSYIFTQHIPANKILSFGKLRLAYGQTGNDASVYLTEASFGQAYSNAVYASNVVNFPVNGVNAFISSTTIGSSTLQPEINTEFEVGTNVQFLNGRIGLDAAFYNRNTDKQIFSLPIDPATGYNNAVINFGKVNNKGVELLLTTTPVKTKLFRWDLSFNFARNYNKVVSLPEELREYDEDGNAGGLRVNIYSFSAGNDAVYMYAEEGKPMGIYYTYLPQYDDNGNLIVKSNGQPLLTEEVQSTGYDMNHKWTGGATTSFSAYGFTLSASLDVRYGGKMFSRTRNILQFTGNGIETTYNDRNPFVIPNSVVVAYDWNEAGTALVPQYDDKGKPIVAGVNTTAIYVSNGSYQEYFDSYGSGEGGAAYLVDRSYAKLRNISLSWDLPTKWLKYTKLSAVSFTAFVNNAFIWTAKDNHYIDPEGSTIGNDLSGQFGELYVNPSCRIYGCNLRVKF